jgi:hypothetical protein
MLALALFAFLSSSAIRPKLEKKAPNPTDPPVSFMCLICDIIVPIVELELENGQTVDQITMCIENLVCSYVAEDVRDICNLIIETEVPAIIEAIEKDMDETHICRLLGFCP